MEKTFIVTHILDRCIKGNVALHHVIHLLPKLLFFCGCIFVIGITGCNLYPSVEAVMIATFPARLL